MQDHAKVRELFGLEIQRLEAKHMDLEEGLNSLNGQLGAIKSENQTTTAAASSNSCKRDNDDSSPQKVVERVTGLWKGINIELTPMVFSPVREKISSYIGKNIYITCNVD